MATYTTHATLVRTVPRRAQRVEPFAPGWPGVAARWTSGARSGGGTAVSRDSRVWFTLSQGIVNEVDYPRVDHACTRDLGFIVTDGKSYFSEEMRDTRSETSQMAPGIPAYRIHNTARSGWREESSPACPFHGEFRSRMTISVGITWSGREIASSGVSTTRCARCRRTEHSAWRRSRVRSSIGASTNRAPCTTPYRGTRHVVFTWPTSRPEISAVATASILRSTGRKQTGGKASTFSCASSDGVPDVVHKGPCGNSASGRCRCSECWDG